MRSVSLKDSDLFRSSDRGLAHVHALAPTSMVARTSSPLSRHPPPQHHPRRPFISNKISATNRTTRRAQIPPPRCLQISGESTRSSNEEAQAAPAWLRADKLELAGSLIALEQLITYIDERMLTFTAQSRLCRKSSSHSATPPRSSSRRPHGHHNTNTWKLTRDSPSSAPWGVRARSSSLASVPRTEPPRPVLVSQLWVSSALT